MSIAVMTEVWRRSRHSGSHLLMMLALADFSDDKGCSYPAVSTLAAKCRTKVRNAQTVLSTLRESGELEIRLSAGPRGCNRYRIVFAALGGVQPSAGVQDAAGVQSLAGDAIECTLQGNAPTPAKDCAKPLQPVAPEPSLNRQEPSKKKARVRAPSFDTTAVELPDWLEGEDWAMWVRHRIAIRKPLSEDGARLALKALDKLRAQGISPRRSSSTVSPAAIRGCFRRRGRRRLSAVCRRMAASSHGTTGSCRKGAHDDRIVETRRPT